MYIFACRIRSTKTLQRLLACVSIILLLPCTTPAIANGEGQTASGDMALDLHSRSASVHVDDRVLPSGQTESITVAGASKEVRAGDRLTPAEFAALAQVLSSGTQDLVLNAHGRATGGSFALNSLQSVQRSVSNLSELVIPKGVTVLRDFASGANLNLTGDLQNSGTFHAYSTSNAVTNATIAAQNILNNQGALLSTVVPAGGFPNAGSVVNNLDLTLAAVQNLVNAGRIESAGNLTATAGGSIVNALPAGATGALPVMQAMNAVNLVSANITNSGQITSLVNNINVTTQMVQNIAINNIGGQLQALHGAINVRDASFTDSASLSLIGGDFLSHELNLYSGMGSVTVDAGNVLGTLNISGGATHVRTESDTLSLGHICLAGDPTFYNTGDILITDTVTATENLAILAEGNITATNSASRIIVSGATQGFNLLMVAGADLTSAGSTSSSLPPGTATLSNVSIDLTSGPGGDIDLSASTALDVIDTSTNFVGGPGGNVTLVARASASGVGGRVILPTTSITRSIDSHGGSPGGGGNVMIIAGATSGTAISVGNINTNGGDVQLSTANPISDGNPVVVLPTGLIQAPNFIQPSTNTRPAGIFTGQIDAGNGGILLTAGTTIAAEALVTTSVGGIFMTAGGDIGSSLNRVVTSAPNFSISSSDGNVYLGGSGNTTVNGAGAGPGKIFDLTVITGAGNITINDDITAPAGTINLAAGFAGGSITQPAAFAVLRASTVNLAAGGVSGSIGSVANPIRTDSANLTANAPGGSVFIEGNRTDSVLPISLGPSSAGNGATFQVKSASGSGSGINVTGDIAATAGTIGTIILAADGNGEIAAGGGTLTATQVFLSSDLTGVPNAGSGNITANTVALTQPFILTANTAGGHVSIQNSGSVSLGISSAGSGKTFKVTITPGTGGSISPGFVAAPAGSISEIQLIADGAGGISGGVITQLRADRIVLRSDSASGPGTGTGNIGASFPTVVTDTPFLSVLTQGSVFVVNTRDVFLGPSSAGGGQTFDLRTFGPFATITLTGNIAAPSGTIANLRLAVGGDGGIGAFGPAKLTATNISLSSNNGTPGAGTGNIGGDPNSRILTSATNLTVITQGSVFLENTGSVALGPSFAGVTFSLITTPGSNGSIALVSNVSAMFIGLASDGTGSITRATGTLSATSITLGSSAAGVFGAGSGNIGTSSISGHIWMSADQVTAATTGSAFLRNDGAVSLFTSQAGGCQTCTVQVVTAPGSNGSISITGQVRGGTVNLTADGSGTITSPIVGDCAVCGNIINLKSGTGNIGTSTGSRLEIASNDEGTISHLTANTKGNVFLLAREDVNLFGSSAGNSGTFNLLTLAGCDNPITINGDVKAGTIVLLSDVGIFRSSGTLFGNTINLSSSGGPGQIGSGAASPVVVGPLDSVVSLTVTTDGNAFLQNSSNVSLQASTGGGNKMFSVVGASGSGAGIDIAGNVVAGTGTLLRIRLSSDGSGSITRTAGTLTATNVDLSSDVGGILGAGTGNIGSSTQAILTATGNLSANTSGTGIVNVSNPGSGPLTLGTSKSGSAFTFNSGGSLTTGAVTAGGTLSLTSTSSLSVGTLTAGSTLSLTSGGSLTTGALTAGGTLSLTSAGSLTAGPLTSGGTLSLTSGGSLTVGALTSGATLSLTSTSSLTIDGPLNTLNGGATVVANTGTLTVSTNAVILVKEGDLLLRKADTGAGSINIGSSANIQTLVTGKTSGKVSIVIGPVPAVPGKGKTPPNVTVVKQKPGAVFFGLNGITAAAAPNPKITLRALKQNIVFNKPAGLTTTISLGGGVLIVADPLLAEPRPRPAITGHALVSSSVGAQGTGSIALPLATSAFTLTLPNASSIIPVDTTFPASSPDQHPDPGIVHQTSAGLQPVENEESNPESRQNQDIGEDSALEPVAYRPSAAYPADGASAITTVRSGKAVINHSGQARFDATQPDCLTLRAGEILVRAEDDTAIRCGDDLVSVARGSIVLVGRSGDVVKVRNLHEPRSKSARVQFNGKWVVLSAGEEMILAPDDTSLSSALRSDAIGRRKSESFVADGGKLLVHSEISPVSLIQRSALLNGLTHTKADRTLTNMLVKMAACLMQVTAKHGPYAIITDPAKLTRIDLRRQL